MYSTEGSQRPGTRACICMCACERCVREIEIEIERERERGKESIVSALSDVVA